MEIRELKVPDAFEITPKLIGDSRGMFLEWYRFDKLAEAVGHSLDLKQGNMSVSARGVVRGIHFADIPPGQAKYVTCPKGAVVDFVVDIRAGSPTFGQWDQVRLDDVDRKAIYIAEGLGHCFVSLEEGSVVSYLVSDTYAPGREHGINPLCKTVGLDFGMPENDLLLSDKDTAAPDLLEAQAQGLLPTFEQAQLLYSDANVVSHIRGDDSDVGR